MQSESTDTEQIMLIQQECLAPELESSLLRQLECPEFNEYMRPAIILCERGCKVCENCKSGYRNCKICKGYFVKARSLALENLARQVKYPCKSYGCTEMLDHGTIDGHQVECLHFPQKCPSSKLNCEYCKWSGDYNDIKRHLQSNHLEVCCEYTEGDFKFLCSLDTPTKFFCSIFAYNEIFFSLFEEKHDMFYAVLMYVGPVENAAKYRYKVEFVKKDDTERVTLMHLTRSYNENVHDVYRSGNCGKLHYDAVSRLKDKEGNVKFKLEIIRVNN
jgi:hypothetical protein